MSADLIRVPSYRKHKQSGQGIVTLTDGLGQRKDVLLGKYGTEASRMEYVRVIAEWESSGRRLPTPSVSDIGLAEFIDAFWPWVERHYRHPDGTPTTEVGEYKLALRIVNHLYGHTLAQDFGPKALKAVRQLMVEGYTHATYGPQPALARGVVNKRIARIRRMFKWGIESEMLPPSVLHGLQAVGGLQRGRSAARETEDVKPVARAAVQDTLPHLPPVVADMVRLQLETGMRPGELVVMRARDIDITGAVWLYRLLEHKTAHRGHQRTVPIGPKGQAIIRRYLSTDLNAFLFSPRESAEQRNTERRKDRKTPRWPSHVRHQEKKRAAEPKRSAGIRYHVTAYARAIARGCEKAFPPPEHLGPRTRDDGRRETPKQWLARLTAEELSKLREWRKTHHWHPHQLRHTRALELKREAGLDVARAVLGHRSPAITEHYATLDIAKAAEVMAKLG